MDIRRFKTDEARERDGVWMEIGDGAELLIARLGNSRYRKEYARRMRPYRTQVRQGTLPDHVEEKVLIGVINDTVLLGWRGMKDGEKELPYSPEVALEVLTDLRDFRDLVVSLAEDAEKYRAQAQADAEGN